MRIPHMFPVAVAVSTLLMSACASNGRAERAGRAVDRGVDRVHDEADDAADKTERGLDRARDKIDRAVDELKN